MRCACIDIGSNTTRLLVAEPDGAALRTVVAARVFNRLHGERGPLTAERIRELAATVAEQAAAARAAGAGSIDVVATAAVRRAANADALCAAIGEASGERVAVLGGEEEARLAFLGATGTLARAPDGVLAVVDVGGGSTEIVCGTAAAGVSWSVSLPEGSGTLTGRLVAHDPPTASERAALAATAQELMAGIDPPAAVAAYAVGGSATSLRRIVGPALAPAALAITIDAVCAEPAAALAARLDLHAERARVLPAGLTLLAAAGHRLGLELEVAAGGLREGVILDRLANDS